MVKEIFLSFHLSVNSKHVIRSMQFLPNFILIGALCRPCGASNLEFNRIWNFWAPISPGVDDGEIWNGGLGLILRSSVGHMCPCGEKSPQIDFRVVPAFAVDNPVGND